MDIVKIASKAKKTLSDNSPVILTALGVTGTITTAYLTAKATFKAAKKIEDAEFVKKQSPGYIKSIHRGELTKKDKFKLVWPLYVPAGVTAVATCSCIIGANYIGTKRAAALAAAYSLSQEALTEYKNQSPQKVHDAVAQERVNNNPPPKDVVIVGGGDVLCHDAYSNTYFMSSKNAIEKAQNEINYKINRSAYATLTEFYDKLGLPPTSVSDELGWNCETNLELLWATAETPDGKPCLSYDFATIPIRYPDLF